MCKGTPECRFTGAIAVCNRSLLACMMTKFERELETDSEGREIVDFMRREDA